MPGTPGRFGESLTTEEVFPRSLPAQTQDLQFCQLPAGKVRRLGHRPGNELAHQRAAAGRDPVEQLAVLGRIGLVDATTEDGNRRAGAPERSCMRGRIDATRTARDHLDLAAREVLSERPRQIESLLVA